mmetsp:Transcript_7132/g.20895  ORF Transcript_7132/g.20895 Transcript_7132/m.20895 type:complete len:135 (+) Transcript_7132:240-644(+)
MREQTENEIQRLSQHYQQLQEAQGRFGTCMAMLNEIKPECEDREMLVPLTESLYVPGKIKDANKVLVNVGTGYLVEKSLPKAQELIERKIGQIGTNCEGLQQVISARRKNLEVISMVFNNRIRAGQAAGAQQAS